MWRNWQTRRSQKPVMVTSWRFKSSHPHHNFGRAAGLALLIGIKKNKGMRSFSEVERGYPVFQRAQPAHIPLRIALESLRASARADRMSALRKDLLSFELFRA